MPLNDILVIDSHNHIGPWKAFHAPNNSAEGMLVSMDNLGIDKVCITSHSSVGPNYRYGNDVVRDAVTRYPDRFMGYVTLNPNYHEDIKNELDRCLTIKGFIGIKMHPSSHGSPIDNPKFNTAFEIAHERKLPVLIHVWGKGDVAAIDKVSQRYPNAQFLMGHAGADINAMGDAINIVNRTDNTYLDLAISLTYEGNVEWFVKEVGSKRVLFGTDMPFFDPRPTFGRVAMADISDEEKKDIYGLNMMRLVKL